MNKLSDEDLEDIKGRAVAIVICAAVLIAFLSVYDVDAATWR